MRTIWGVSERFQIILEAWKSIKSFTSLREWLIAPIIACLEPMHVYAARLVRTMKNSTWTMFGIISLHFKF